MQLQISCWMFQLDQSQKTALCKGLASVSVDHLDMDISRTRGVEKINRRIIQKMYE